MLDSCSHDITPMAPRCYDAARHTLDTMPRYAAHAATFADIFR